mgnify:FL=1
MKKKISLIMSLMLVISLFSLTGCGSASGEKKGEVRVYCLGDYFDPELISQFEDKTGISVVADYFDTNEEMYPVISKGSVDYDVICVSDYMISRLISEGLLQKYDAANIPNLANIDDKYMKMSESFDPDMKYTVPHTWGTLGILYNKEHIAQDRIRSWNDLWREEFSQQIVMPDSMRDTYAIALKALGYSINTTDENEIKAATEYLEKQKSLVYKYANDSARDMAIGGYADIAVVWNGEVLYSQEDNDSLEFIIPEEGSESFLDMWAITAAAKNKENGETWINFMLGRDTALMNFDYLTYSIPNKAVIDEISSDARKTGYLFPDESITSKCEMLRNLGAEGDDLYSKYWKEFKAQ